jgi:hypothetical protein
MKSILATVPIDFPNHIEAAAADLFRRLELVKRIPAASHEGQDLVWILRQDEFQGLLS